MPAQPSVPDRQFDPLIERARSARLAGRGSEAEALEREAVEQQPVEAYLQLGMIAQQEERFEQALSNYERAVDLRPDFAEAWFRIGTLRDEKLQYGEAVSAYHRTLVLDPDFAFARYRLGVVQRDLGALSRAIETLGEALRDMPDRAEVHSALGEANYGLGSVEQARAHFEKALGIDANCHAARFGLCTSELMPGYMSDADLRDHRRLYQRRLEHLAQHYRTAPAEELSDAADDLDALVSLFLPYQGEDDRDLQIILGGLICRLTAARYPRWAQPIPPREERNGRRLRVGFVSGYFFPSSIWKIPTKGWVEHLDREQFELYGYDIEPRIDGITNLAAIFDHFTQGRRPVADWCRQIEKDRLDALIYGEVGIHPIALRLASLRLAPIQITSLAHPQTTGLPTIDFFLSSDLMEPPDGQDHYTEKLIQLPNLAIHYSEPLAQCRPMDREEFGLKQEDVCFWCCQSLFKYLPAHDDVFVRIALRVPDARFIFLKDRRPSVVDTFRNRLRKVFEGSGIDFEKRVVFLPRMSKQRFAAVARGCDVSLDSIGWSGFNTTLETLAQGCPVVTLPGELMRGRHTLGILTRIGLSDLVARNKAEYVEIAERLATDKVHNAMLRAQIGKCKGVLYEDTEAIRGLERVLLKLADRQAKHLRSE